MMISAFTRTVSGAVLMSLLILLFSLQGVRADTIWFKNGDRLTGEIKSLDGGKLVVASPYGGTLALDWSAISTLQSDSELVLRDGALGKEYRVRLDKADAGQVAVADIENGKQQALSVTRFKRLVKPKARIPDLSWSGNATAGVNLKKAATKSDDYHLAFNAKASHGMWRHEVGGNYDREQEDHSVNTNNYGLRYSLDHFLTERYFWQGRLIFKRDWIEDLSRQTLIGTGPGYQFWDDGLGSFSLAALIGSVGYRYSDGESDRFAAAALRWDYQRYLFGQQWQIFARGEVARSLDGAIYSLDAETGFRYKLTDWALLNLSYGHNQVSGTRDSLNERRLTTGLGINW